MKYKGEKRWKRLGDCRRRGQTSSRLRRRVLGDGWCNDYTFTTLKIQLESEVFFVKILLLLILFI